jgi:hypothetical protein
MKVSRSNPIHKEKTQHETHATRFGRSRSFPEYSSDSDDCIRRYAQRHQLQRDRLQAVTVQLDLQKRNATHNIVGERRS